MIFIFWLTYAAISLVCSLFIRNIFEKKFFRSFFFSLALSFFWAFWFREPGGNELAPIAMTHVIGLGTACGIHILEKTS